MSKTTRLWLAALGLGLCPLAAPVRAEGLIPPFKVNFVFRFDVYSTATPHPSAPWWAYFPQDTHPMAPASGPTYPNWPTHFPPQAQPTAAPRTPPAGPNVVYGYPPAASVQPVSYYQGPPPSYWYGR